MIRLTSLLLKMLLSCTATRGMWRFQPVIFDDTEHTACSAMTSPYRQGVNSYIVHFHSLFQAFRTLRELDITYSLLTFFYQHIAIHGEHYLCTLCWCSWPSQTLSELLVTFSGYFEVAVMRRSRCWESLALFVFRVSPLRSVKDQGRARGP